VHQLSRKKKDLHGYYKHFVKVNNFIQAYTERDHVEMVLYSSCDLPLFFAKCYLGLCGLKLKNLFSFVSCDFFGGGVLANFCMRWPNFFLAN
jgi:hypothetical protein